MEEGGRRALKSSAVTLLMPLRWPLCTTHFAGAAFSLWLYPFLCIWKAVCVASDFLPILSKEDCE